MTIIALLEDVKQLLQLLFNPTGVQFALLCSK
jgi:hypothetical protein